MGKIQFGDHVKSIFSIFLFAFYQNYHKTFFRGLFSWKEKMKKFLPTNLYPNRYFYSLEKLVSYPEYHHTLFLGQFCQNTKKKFQIFVQNHGQPLWKNQIWWLSKNWYFYTTERLVSYSKLPQTLFLGHFCPKKCKEEILI